RRIAAVLSVQARAATVEEEDGKTRRGEEATGVLVPSAVALDAMYADDAGQRGAGRLVAAVLPAIAVAGGEALHGFARRDHALPFSWGRLPACLGFGQAGWQPAPRGMHPALRLDTIATPVCGDNCPSPSRGRRRGEECCPVVLM